MALLTAAALRKKTALSLQDRKNPLLKLLPFVSKVKRKAESSIFFFTFRHVQHSLQRGHIALFFFHKCPTESGGSQQGAHLVSAIWKKKYEGMYFSLDEIQNFFNAMSVS